VKNTAPLAERVAVLDDQTQEMGIQVALFIFGLNPKGTSLPIAEDTLGAMYKHFSAKLHPDKGGDSRHMARLSEAYALLKKASKEAINEGEDE